ncbi:hypothetical protein VZT92_009074 [Zoarces viviparus]|uniref:Nucleolar and spindle-associated protein 1 n=1 Tax=Zoarces viviparus TaxID=48416 RepID=A0AAW1FHS5_ZOAVI
MDLDSMKYAELRSLAKELGLKANMKADKLLKAIKQHYKRENDQQEEGQVQETDVTIVQEDESVTQDGAQENKDSSDNEDVFSRAVFVNTRRGKRNGTKRKICDIAAVAESDARLPPSATEGDTEVAASRPSRGAKKRKVSSTKDSDKSEAESPQEPPATGSEQQQQPPPDIQDEAPVQSDTEKVARAGKIPRFQGRQQKNKPLLNPVTPNFKKLHEAQFNKMKSIDTYVQRKTKQMETSRSSTKTLKRLSPKTKPQQVEGKTQVKANQSRASMFSPVSVTKRPAEDRRTLLSAIKAPPNKPAGKEDAPFRPSVLSTRRINVRFSEATRKNNGSSVKTPARKTLCVTSSTPQKQPAGGGKPRNANISTFSAPKSPGAFVFIGNTSTSTTPGTQNKPAFDLKASLSRALTYKPHSGKLKPFAANQENATANKSLIGNSHQKNYKQPKVQTRGDRRAKHAEDRKQKKASMLGARRGLVMM